MQRLLNDINNKMEEVKNNKNYYNDLLDLKVKIQEWLVKEFHRQNSKTEVLMAFRGEFNAIKNKYTAKENTK